MTQAEIEERLIALEAEIKLLKSRPNKADPKWVLARAGRFAGDPGFDEVVRLGREYRESLRPKEKKAKKGTTGSRKSKGVGPGYLTEKYAQKKKPSAIQKPKMAAKYGSARYGRPQSTSTPTG
jgi:hypothetical protein